MDASAWAHLAVACRALEALILLALYMLLTLPPPVFRMPCACLFCQSRCLQQMLSVASATLSVPGISQPPLPTVPTRSPHPT